MSKSQVIFTLLFPAAFISASTQTLCKSAVPVTFESAYTIERQCSERPFDHTEPFDFEYDDGLATLSLSSPVENMCEGLRIQALHACSLASVEFYVFGGGSLDVHIWEIDSLRSPSTRELIPSFIQFIDSTSYGGWEEIELPSRLYIPPFGECFVGRKIVHPFRPTLYLSRMEDVENRSFLYIPSSRQWLKPNYADSTGSWYVTYLVRAHGWYYNVPDNYIFELDTSIITMTNKGVALCDCDGDTDADLATGSQIYRNDSGSFRIVGGTGISGIGYPFWGDFDMNESPDIFLCGGIGTDKLYANSGTGFSYYDVTAPAGDLSNSYITEAAAWLDFDKDGDLDIYVANSALYDSTDSAWTFYPDLFYQNEGAYFSNVTNSVGIGPAITIPLWGAGVALGDWNNDGWTDIYVANGYNAPNYLWQNNAGTGFTEVAFFYGVDGLNEGGGIFGHSMGACFGDIDNDGDLDLFVANQSPAFGYSTSDKSMLYINEGPPYFYMTDQRAMRGIGNHLALSVPLFFDYDNDGWLDLFVTAMTPGDYTILYRNNGDGTFTDVIEVSGLVQSGASSVGYADLDLDGYLDLVVEADRDKLVYKNNTPGLTGETNRWARFRLESADGNKLGIGTRIYLYADGIRQMREIGAGYGGLRSQSEPVAHFGIGSATIIDSVVIRWNSGSVERVFNVLPNFNYHWVEGTHGIDEAATLPQRISIFSRPNPFNGACRIEFAGFGANALVEVFDIRGSKVSSASVTSSDGNGRFDWRPEPSIPGGVYLVRVSLGEKSAERKILYVK